MGTRMGERTADTCGLMTTYTQQARACSGGLSSHLMAVAMAA